jgi:hypothetical protein
MLLALRVTSRLQDIEVKRLRVSVEPPAEYSARVRVQMPNGAKLDRRFLPQDTVQHVREFLEVYVHDNNIPIVNFSISTHYPKRTLSDPSQTIEEAVSTFSFTERFHAYHRCMYRD